MYYSRFCCAVNLFCKKDAKKIWLRINDLHAPVSALIINNSMTVPFTYYLYHKPTGLKYYGVKFEKGCNPSVLWSTYFTSSSKVKALIDEYGVDSFDVAVRKVFNDSKKALLWEHRVLSRLNAAGRSDWLNRHNGGSKFRAPKAHKEETKARIAAKITGKKRSDTTKQRISQSALLREEQRRLDNWTMPKEAINRAIATRKERTASGEIDPYSAERNAKMAASKRGKKRKYLPDGSFIMVDPSELT